MECLLCDFHLLFVVIVVALIIVGNLPIWKGSVGRNPSWHNYLSPGERSGRGWSVICRVYFVKLYHIFRCLHSSHAHSYQELSFRKGWVGCNPYGHYYLRPPGRSRRGLSCLSKSFSYFLSSSSSRSLLLGSVSHFHSVFLLSLFIY